MKKIIFSIALMALYASTAFAADPTGIVITNTGLSLYACKGTGCTVTADDKSRVGRTSTGVSMGMKTDPSGYSLATQHKNGTKVYGSAYDSTSIYVKDVAAKGTAEEISYTTGKDTFNGVTGWSTM